MFGTLWLFSIKSVNPMVEALNNFRLFLLQTQSNWFVDSASPWYIYPTFTRMWLTMALKNKINLTTDFIHHRQSASAST